MGVTGDAAPADADPAAQPSGPALASASAAGRLPRPLQLVQYLAAGGGSLLLDLLLQYVFIELLHLPAWLATAASYELALLAHFLANHWWVFRQRGNGWRRLVEYHGAALAAEAITLAVTDALVYGPLSAVFGHGAGPYAAKIAGTGAAFVLTFLSSFFWIWRPGRR